MGVHRLPPHDYFWLVYDLTGGDVTKHLAKYNELKRTPYMWVLAYLDKNAEMKIKQNKGRK